MPGTWAILAINMGHSLGAFLPDACGVISGSPPSLSRQWFESEIRHLFDGGLHNRAAVGNLCLLSIFLLSLLVVAQIPQPTDGALLQTTPALGDSADGATIRLQRCLSIAVSVTLLLEIWYTACPSAQAVSVWSWHSWIFDTTSLLNSPGTLRVPVRFVGAVCRRFSEPVP